MSNLIKHKKINNFENCVREIQYSMHYPPPLTFFLVPLKTLTIDLCEDNSKRNNELKR